MKLIASMWAIPIALCLLGAAFADELTTSGDAKSLGFSAARLARIAPWYQARFDSFPPSDGLVPGAVVAIAKGRQARLFASHRISGPRQDCPDEDEFHLLDRLDVQTGDQRRRHDSG